MSTGDPSLTTTSLLRTSQNRRFQHAEYMSPSQRSESGYTVFIGHCGRRDAVGRRESLASRSHRVQNAAARRLLLRAVRRLAVLIVAVEMGLAKDSPARRHSKGPGSSGIRLHRVRPTSQTISARMHQLELYGFANLRKSHLTLS